MKQLKIAIKCETEEELRYVSKFLTKTLGTGSGTKKEYLQFLHFHGHICLAPSVLTTAAWGYTHQSFYELHHFAIVPATALLLPEETVEIAGHKVRVIDENTVKVGCRSVTREEIETLLGLMNEEKE